MQQKVSQQLTAKIDNNQYDDSQLIELKVPINLPYQTNWSTYQRYDGEIEVAGVMYKYVKRKVADDTLYLMCIPNTKKMHLETAKNDFFKMSNDLAQNNKSKKSDNSKTPVFKKITSDFDDHNYCYEFNTLANSNESFAGYTSLNLLSFPRVSPEQPPDLQVG